MILWSWFVMGCRKSIIIWVKLWGGTPDDKKDYFLARNVLTYELLSLLLWWFILPIREPYVCTESYIELKRSIPKAIWRVHEANNARLHTLNSWPICYHSCIQWPKFMAAVSRTLPLVYLWQMRKWTLEDWFARHYLASNAIWACNLHIMSRIWIWKNMCTSYCESANGS